MAEGVQFAQHRGERCGQVAVSNHARDAARIGTFVLAKYVAFRGGVESPSLDLGAGRRQAHIQQDIGRMLVSKRLRPEEPAEIRTGERVRTEREAHLAGRLG